LKEKGIANDFLTRTPTTQQIRAWMGKCGCTELKSFGIAKKTVTRMNSQWEKNLYQLHMGQSIKN
jgi:uncharacterized protein YPO0396